MLLLSVAAASGCGAFGGGFGNGLPDDGVYFACTNTTNHGWTWYGGLCNDGNGNETEGCWVPYNPAFYYACVNAEDGFDVDTTDWTQYEDLILDECVRQCEKRDPRGDLEPNPECEASAFTEVNPQPITWMPGELNCVRAYIRSADIDGAGIDWGGGEVRAPVSCDLNGDCCEAFDAPVCEFINTIGQTSSSGRGGDYFATAENGSDLAINMPGNNADDTEPVYAEAEYSASECGEETCPFYLGHLMASGDGSVWDIKVQWNDLGLFGIRKDIKNLQVELTQPLIAVWSPGDGRVAFQADSLQLRVEFDVVKGGVNDSGDGHYNVVVTNDKDTIGYFSNGNFSISTNFPLEDGTGTLDLSFSPVLHPPTAAWGGGAVLECDSFDGATLNPSFDLSSEPNGLDYFSTLFVDGGPMYWGQTLGFGTHDLSVYVENENRAADATDAASVDVMDFTEPMIWCPGDQAIECTEIGGTAATDPQVLSFVASAAAQDICDEMPTLSNDAPAFFPLGQTPVNFWAQDNFANWSQCLSTLSVEDTSIPEINCPDDIVIECNAFGGVDSSDPQVTAFLAGASATDTCDPAVAIANDAPAFFGLGATPVTFAASDASGNVSECIASVTVQDTTAPMISVGLTPESLWPPNHKMATVGASIQVTDVCDPSPTFVLTEVVSSEPDNGTGDGNTVNDIQGTSYGTPDTSIQLRQERSGGGSGRVYTATYTASDASSNSSSASDEVIVPKSNG